MVSVRVGVAFTLALGCAAALESCGAGSPVPDPGSAVAARETTVIARPALDQGATAYLAYCAVCHGARGAGDGPLAAELESQGAVDGVELDDRARLDELGREGIIKQIAAGPKHTGRLNLTPPWSDLLDEPTTNSVADYVLTLPDSMAAPMADAMALYLSSPVAGAPHARESYVYFCSSCHGAKGKGDGPAADLLKQRQDVRPRALNDHGYFAGRSDEQITAALSLGGGHVGRSLYMPAWNHPFSPTQVADFVAYVRHLSHTQVATAASTP